MSALPRGWPDEVPPPDAPEWQRRAVGWLLDQCPGDFRSYDVLRRHPTVLARFAAEHVAACRAAIRDGLAGARPDLRHLPPDVLDDVVAAYETEAARLARLAQAVDLVGRALGGQRFVARLDDDAR
ncbi:MAG TPA: hypothetical protein VGX28_15910 [Frankiaceae bacterium]|nr:hypothetical protein [Frankiaceae bacterium]